MQTKTTMKPKQEWKCDNFFPKSNGFSQKNEKKNDVPFPFLFITFVQNFTQKHIVDGGTIPHWKPLLG
jgi:hypothetical protein